jgi:tail tape measure protein
MANRIKGITVEIGGETTKFQTALKGVNGQIKNTQSALRDVERLLKLDPHKINFSLELKLIFALFISFYYILHQYFF